MTAAQPRAVVAFDAFKGRTEEISVELNQALDAVLVGISGMDRSFTEGDTAMADETRAKQSSTSFDAARFGSGK